MRIAVSYDRCHSFFISVFTLLLISIATDRVSAQIFHFPKAHYADSTTLARTLPVLAATILQSYKAKDKGDEYDAKFRIALAAQQYEAAIAYVDSFRRSDPSEDMNGVAFQFEMYARACMQQDGGPFEQRLRALLSAYFPKLNEPAQARAAGYAGAPLASIKSSFESMVKDYRKKDSLTLNEAYSLVRSYNSYLVYSSIAATYQSFMAVMADGDFVTDKTLVTTSDGSSIQVTIVRSKKTSEPLPAVLVWSIYADEMSNRATAKKYAAKGYVGIVANTRGKAGSPQVIAPFEHDADDAYDVIDWISKQAWCNKQIGMTGGSYLGFAQWAAVKRLHPALKTIMPQVAVGPGIDFPKHNNVYMAYMLPWIHLVTNDKQTDYADFGRQDHWEKTITTWYKQGRAFRALDSIEGRPNAIFQRWLQHPSFDAYWQKMTSTPTEFAKLNIPVLTTTGYYDEDQIGALHYYRHHMLRNPAAQHYVVIGPYDHAGAQEVPKSSYAGYQFDSVAVAVNFDNLAVAWFDYVLKGKAKPALLKDKVNFAVMGTNTWRHASSLAGMSNSHIRYYFSGQQQQQDYLLSSMPSAGKVAMLQVDLADRSDTAKTYRASLVDSTLDRSTAISFVIPVLDKPLTVSGAFAGKLVFSINKRDVDLKLSFFERRADGTYLALHASDNIVRASYAADRSKRQLLTPNKKAVIELPNWYVVSKQLPPGSSLVVVVGVLKSKYWQINYGTGKDVSEETIADAGAPMQITWYGDSFIEVPVLK